MTGRLDLLTPWARDALPKPDRHDVIDAIPDDHRLDVSVTANHGTWVFRLTLPDGEHKGPLRVSGSMSLRAACFYALRHWGLARGTTYTTDAEGYIRSITDAD